MELLQKAAEEYDWEAIEAEIEPEFRKAAVDFRDCRHSFVCPSKDELDKGLQESSPFLSDMAEAEVAASKGRTRRKSDDSC